MPEYSFATFFTGWMYLVSIVAHAPLLIQSLTVINNRSSKNLSIPAFSIYAVVALSWLTYAILLNNRVLMLSSTIGLILGSFLLSVIIKYRDGVAEDDVYIVDEDIRDTSKIFA